MIKGRLFFQANVFRDDFKRKALLCYITKPFRAGKRKHHSNAQECKAIAKEIAKLNFNVDVIDYDALTSVNYDQYDLIFGFGDVFEKGFEFEDCIRIHYQTGSAPAFQDYAEVARCLEFENTFKLKALPCRTVDRTWPRSLCLSDAVIVIGNRWTIDTFTNYRNNVRKINATVVQRDFHKKSIQELNNGRYKLLWFSGKGLIHKGFDLCVLVIQQLKDLGVELTVCCPDAEEYLQLAQCIPNFDESKINFHGYCDPNSKEFDLLAKAHTFSIFLSCSEGQSTSLLQVAAAGVIPIHNRQAGFDPIDTRLLLTSMQNDQVVARLRSLMALDELHLASLSQAAADRIAVEHTLRSFSETLKTHLQEVLNERASQHSYSSLQPS